MLQMLLLFLSKFVCAVIAAQTTESRPVRFTTTAFVPYDRFLRERGHHRHHRLQVQLPVQPVIRVAVKSDTIDIGSGTVTRTANNAWNTPTIEFCRTLWNLTPEQTFQLCQLGERLTTEHKGGSIVTHPKNNPYDVARFVVEYGQSKSLDEIEAKFRSMIAWRQEHNIDDVLETYSPPSLYRYFPGGVLWGVDGDGDPIHVERTVAADSSGLLQEYG